MTSLRFLCAATVAAATISAQTNPFVFYPQDPERQTITCTSFVGRPDLSNQAEAHMEISTDDFRSVADANGLIYLFGVFHWLADENLSTSETYDLVIRDANPNGPGPDMTPGGEALRITGLTSPPSTLNQRGTWEMQDGFGSQAPFTVTSVSGFTPLPGRYYVGVDLPANPAWPATDGHSLFRADLLSANTTATVGENERLGAPDPTWGGSVGSQAYTTPWSYILGPLVTSPNLHVGGIDPLSNRLGAPGANLSMNGLYPDISGQPRSDGLMVRITDNLAPFGVAAIGASFNFGQPQYLGFMFPQYLGVVIGHSHFTTVIPLDTTTLNNGEVDIPIAPPTSISTAFLGTDLILQGIVWDVGINIAQWTNAQAVHL